MLLDFLSTRVSACAGPPVHPPAPGCSHALPPSSLPTERAAAPAAAVPLPGSLPKKHYAARIYTFATNKYGVSGRTGSRGAAAAVGRRRGSSGMSLGAVSRPSRTEAEHAALA